MASAPQLFLRITNNGEKVYAEKLGRFFAGFVFRANFLESSPGLVSSIAVRAATSPRKVGYIIDPMTYIFTLDPTSDPSKSDVIRAWRKVPKDKAADELRADLALSKNDSLDASWTQKIEEPGKRDANKVQIFGLKKSIRQLANKTLGKLSGKAGLTALGSSHYSAQNVTALVDATISYQLGAVKSRLDPDRYKTVLPLVPEPTYILSPYIPIRNQNDLNSQILFWREFDSKFRDDRGMAVVLTTVSTIINLGPGILAALQSLKTKNVAIWLDGFNEVGATVRDLSAFKDFVVAILAQKQVCLNLYGSGYSSFLSSRGLSQTLSCGHGESKGVEPLSGGFPIATYYIRSLHERYRIAAAYNLLLRANLGITRNDFISRVCSCAICKEYIQTGLIDLVRNFDLQGEARPTRRGPRSFPTGEALTRCKFHYLLNRVSEFKDLSAGGARAAIQKLSDEKVLWAGVPGANNHLDRWIASGI